MVDIARYVYEYSTQYVRQIHYLTNPDPAPTRTDINFWSRKNIMFCLLGKIGRPHQKSHLVHGILCDFNMIENNINDAG